ncbi:MAG: glycosyltransferase family 4 protein [Flavobacteriaceae bacterium]|nr:glycosyltransferase family 4 protein [Flavobacteriaceae bacterium]MCI5087592.1 glycosyltransferase family 4 protein [Flavobacteriaceae bacterium]CAI8199349.1 MAG: Uncharacterised protein [SAR116 cluster bacterium]
MTQKLLCISTVWPEDKATAAGVRLMGLLDMLAPSFELHFAASSKDQNAKKFLEKTDVFCHEIHLNDPGFKKLLQELLPQVVLFDRFIAEEQFGWIVRETLPEALCILDTEDLHSLRASRALSLKNNRPFSLDFWKEQQITHRELASIYRSDLSLIVSSYEHQLLIREWELSEHLLMLLPLSYKPLEDSVVNELAPYDQTQGYVFIGNGLHKPNVDAIKWLYAHIWPLILKLQPQATINIYGAYLPQEILELDRAKKGFHVRGHIVPTANAFKTARVNLAPLRFGAGIKGKILDGFRFGVPNITTEIGAEGMQYEKEWPGLIANSAAHFAEAAVSLHENESLWQEKRNLGLVHMDKYYNANHHSKELINKLESIRSSLQSHRRSHIQTQVLSSQAFMASKYLSLWIQEKNKNN